MQRTKQSPTKPVTNFQRTKPAETALIPPKQGDTVLFIMEGDTVVYKGLVLCHIDGYYKVSAIDWSIIIDASTQVRNRHELHARSFYRVQRDNYGNPSVRLTHIKYYRSQYNNKGK